jgi:hypothetical protein
MNTRPSLSSHKQGTKFVAKGFFNQTLGALKIAKALFFVAIAVIPFLMSQMGYTGRVIDRIGAVPGYIYYVFGYLAALNFVDQLLTVKYVRPYRDMPVELQRKWKRFMITLSLVALVSIYELVQLFAQTQTN